jgi:hypothetical protein
MRLTFITATDSRTLFLCRFGSPHFVLRALLLTRPRLPHCASVWHTGCRTAHRSRAHRNQPPPELRPFTVRAVSSLALLHFADPVACWIRPCPAGAHASAFPIRCAQSRAGSVAHAGRVCRTAPCALSRRPQSLCPLCCPRERCVTTHRRGSTLPTARVHAVA